VEGFGEKRAKEIAILLDLPYSREGDLLRFL